MKPLTLTYTTAVLAALAGCSTITPTDDPLYLRLTDMEARLIRIERVMDNESLIALAGDITALRNDTQALRGEVETLRFETQNAAERQRDLYVDLDERMQQVEQGQASGFASGAAASAQGGFSNAAASSSAAAVNDQQAYDSAFAMIQDRRYAEAGNAFNAFLRTYPSSPLRANAQYWLAETRYVQREFAAALGEFERVIEQYPQSDKLPDALLKVGYCNFELREWDAARQALQQVTRLYPDTTAARLAEQRLERIAQEAG